MADDPKEPYGDVDYADPGYQDDGKKRYPLDSEEHCRAAWSYINMPKNADKYTPQQLAKVRGRIKSALKRYGAKVEAAAELKDLELARPGTWKLKSGKLTFTEEMLRDAARFAAKTGARPAHVKIGHRDPRFVGDGEPALGWLGNVRMERDGKGPVLKGDITGMPDWLAAAAPTAWPDRSIEGWANYTDEDGETYALVIDALALLGATPPGIKSIRSLRDLPRALGVAASAGDGAIRVVASQSQTSVSEAEEHNNQEGSGMSHDYDPELIREALGLSADASDEQVSTALTGAGLVPAPAPAPVAASEETKETKAEATAQLVKQSGVIRIDASVWQDTQDKIRRLEARAAQMDRDERDKVIASAVESGKFAPARREHWARLWDADPKGTRELIDTLAPNMIPVAASGYSGDGDEDMDHEFAHLFPAKEH
ncbi:MAG TPA: DUF6582 domain-containing protein [Micromonosporaceae bacterium]